MMDDEFGRKSNRTNRKFKPEEDAKLRSLVSKYGEMAWNEIANEMEGRNVRQCHDRWFYYLTPQLNNTPWTKEEDKRLIKLAKEYKGKWVAISKHFNRRTDTQIKNRWNILKKTMKLPEFRRKKKNTTKEYKDLPLQERKGSYQKGKKTQNKETNQEDIQTTSCEETPVIEEKPIEQDSNEAPVFVNAYEFLMNLFDSYDQYVDSNLFFE